MLGLDQLTEGLLVSLAAATGVSRPAQPGSAAEAKQLAALAALVALASGSEAGFLGSGWLIVLRTLSALDSLKVAPASLPFTSSRVLWIRLRDRLRDWLGMAGVVPAVLAASTAESPTLFITFDRPVFWAAGRFLTGSPHCM